MVPFCKLHAPHGPCKPTNFQIYDKRHMRYVPALTNQTVMRRTRGNWKKLMRSSMTKKITSKVSSNRWETMLRQWDLCPPPFMPSWQARKIILCQVSPLIFFFSNRGQLFFAGGLENIENPFERTLHLAMAFGGDADTIMSMTGALAGAYYGFSGIPCYMKSISEGVSNAVRQGDQLHKLVTQ